MDANTNAAPRERVVETPVEAKQGTDTPRGMPIVLIVSTVAAAVIMWALWGYFAH